MTFLPSEPRKVQSVRYNDVRGEMRVILEQEFSLKIAKLTRSKRGVVRGFHWQNLPFYQSKIISVLSGSIHDVCIEVNEGNLTNNKFVFNLSEGETLFVPHNFAHAYQTISNESQVLYLCNNLYGGEVSFNPVRAYDNWPQSTGLIASKKDVGGL